METSQLKTARKVKVKAACHTEIQKYLSPFGKDFLLITGKNSSRAEKVVEEAKDLHFEISKVEKEPTIESIEKASKSFRRKRIDAVIGIGGGSVLDTAKALAALYHNKKPLLNYLEVIGKSEPLEEKVLPIILIPTTSGTGSEAARNSVIGSPKHRVKVSLRSNKMFASLVIIDPTLTLSLPKDVTARTSFDALTQLLEAYVSCKSNAITDEICEKGLFLCHRSITKVYEKPTDLDARAEMAIASLYSGIALTNAGLGAVHGLAGPMGGLFDAPHGSIVAALLPAVIQINTQKIAHSRKNIFYSKYLKVAQILTGKKDANCENLIRWVKDLQKKFSIPTLKNLGFKKEDFALAIENSQKANSMKGNPIPLTDQELEKILELSY